MSACDPCPAGQTCPFVAMNYTLPCPSGYYCPGGSFGDGIPCPIGKLVPSVIALGTESHLRL